MTLREATALFVVGYYLFFWSSLLNLDWFNTLFFYFAFIFHPLRLLSSATKRLRRTIMLLSIINTKPSVSCLDIGIKVDVIFAVWPIKGGGKYALFQEMLIFCVYCLDYFVFVASVVSDDDITSFSLYRLMKIIHFSSFFSQLHTWLLLISLSLLPSHNFTPFCRPFLCPPSLPVCGKPHQWAPGADVQVSGGDQLPHPGETGPGGEGDPGAQRPAGPGLQSSCGVRSDPDWLRILETERRTDSSRRET